MYRCAECKIKTVFIDNSGQPAEFCSNQCRKSAVEQCHVPPCIKCRTWPMVKLPDGTRSPYCGKHCQNSAGISTPGGSPIQLKPPQQPYRSGYPIITSMQLNQPNPPSHPMQLLSNGGTSPTTWATASVPLCRYCKRKPCWKDNTKQSYSSYCTLRCKEAAERTPRVVSNMNNAPFQNYNGQIMSPISTDSTNGTLPSPQGGMMPQYMLYQPHLPNSIQPQQQFQLPPNSSNNTQNPQHYSSNDKIPQQDDNSQQPQANDSTNPSGRHRIYSNTVAPDSRSLDSPPPIPNNKPTQYGNSTPNNTIDTRSVHSPTETHPRSRSNSNSVQDQDQPQSQVSVQVQPEQNQLQSQVSAQVQPEPNQPQPQVISTENDYMDTDVPEDKPPPYTPNEAFTRNTAPGEDRKITRDDSYDDENPYGFNDRNDDLNEQDQDSNQSDNQRTQRNRWLRR